MRRWKKNKARKRNNREQVKEVIGDAYLAEGCHWPLLQIHAAMQLLDPSWPGH